MTRSAYTATVLPVRIALLRRVLAESPRRLVVCYGKHDWPNFDQLFEGAVWRDMPRFRVADFGRTRVILTTHFSGRDFNAESQLARLADAALGNRARANTSLSTTSTDEAHV